MTKSQSCDFDIVILSSSSGRLQTTYGYVVRILLATKQWLRLASGYILRSISMRRA